MYRDDLAPGGYYHVYNRGVDKREIFLEHKDFLRFTVLMYLCNSHENIYLPDLLRDNKIEDLLLKERGKNLVDIGCFCLMPNHFHLLIKIPEDGNDANISLFMQKLITGYVMYFNKRNQRKGTLFEGRYKAKLISNDNYLKYIFSYIHLNPVKLIRPDWREEGLAVEDFNPIHSYLKDYMYSSYLEYSGEPRNGFERILNKEVFPEYFSNDQDFLRELTGWLNFLN